MPSEHRNSRWWNHWFLIGLVVCLAAGYWGHAAFAPIADARQWQHIVVAVVMFLMALPIEFAVVRRVVLRPVAPLLASGINVGLAPVIVWPLLPLLGAEWGPGFAVAAATPCTLASAAVWTRRAGGNEVVAILVTLLTNLACFWVLPAWLAVLTARSSQVAAGGSIVTMLFTIVVLPIVAAQLLRRWQRCALVATRWRRGLAEVCQIGILSIVFVGAVKMGERLAVADESKITVASLVGCAALVLALHLGLFAIGVRTARWLNLAREDQIAVGFAGSQKTLMVGLTAAIELGYTIIPLVMYHVLQLVADTLLADRWRRFHSDRGSGI